MIFPFAIDMPVRRFPFATLALIFINCLIFSLGYTGDTQEGAQRWALTYGAGLQPDQWLTANFIHGDPYHAFVNFVFIWVFGLIVEGNLGWLKFIASYFGIIIVQSALEQLLTQGLSEPAVGSLGSSAAVYGLMAMSFVFAPKSEFDCFWFALFFWGVIRVSFLIVAGMFIFFDIVIVGELSEHVSPNWFRAFGFPIGFVLAIILLKTKLANCMGWDLLHVMSGKYGATARKTAKQQLDEVEQEAAEISRRSVDNAKEQFDQMIDAKAYAAAAKLWKKTREEGALLPLKDEQLLTLTQGLHDADLWADSAPFMAELIDRFPEKSDLIRIKLAQVCVVELWRPTKAIELLQEVDPDTLAREDRLLLKGILHRAHKQIKEGVVELDDAI